MKNNNNTDSGDNQSVKSSHSNDSKVSVAEKECAYCHAIPYQIISLTCDHNFCLNCAYFKIPTEEGNIPAVFICEICQKPTLMSPDLQQALFEIFKEQREFYVREYGTDKGENLISQLDNNIQSNLPLYYSLSSISKTAENTDKRRVNMQDMIDKSEPDSNIRSNRQDVGKELEEAKHRLTTIFETIELNSENNSNNRDLLKESTATLLNNNQEDSGRIEVSVLEGESDNIVSQNNSNLKESYSFTKHFNELRGKTEESNDVQETKPAATQHSQDRINSTSTNKIPDSNLPHSLKTSGVKISNLQKKLKEQMRVERTDKSKDSNSKDVDRDLDRKQSFSDFLKIVNQNRKKKQNDIKKSKKDNKDAKKEGRVMTERGDNGPFDLDKYKHFFKTSVDKSTKANKCDLKGVQGCFMPRNKSKDQIPNRGSTGELKQETIKEVGIQIKSKTNLLLNLKKEGEILKSNIIERLTLNTEKYLNFCDSMIRYFTQEKQSYKSSINTLQAEIDKEYNSNSLQIRAKLIYCEKYDKMLKGLDAEDNSFLEALRNLKKSFDNKLYIGKKTRNDFHEFFKQKIDKSYKHIKHKFSEVTDYIKKKLDQMAIYLCTENLVPELINKAHSKDNMLLNMPNIKFHLDQINNIVSELNVGNPDLKKKVYKSTDKINNRKAFKTVKKEPKELNRKSLDTKGHLARRPDIAKKLIQSSKRQFMKKS